MDGIWPSSVDDRKYHVLFMYGYSIYSELPVGIVRALKHNVSNETIQNVNSILVTSFSRGIR